MFWADLERHHPGIDSLHLPVEVADAWKQRLRTVTTTNRTPDGRQVRTTASRINYRRECLTPVRAFYLDLAHWAVEGAPRWAPWVVPCPVGGEEISRRKDKRRRKSRMDARTRERLTVLPLLVRTVDQRRKHAAALLDAARQTPPGRSFTVAGQTLTRSTTARIATLGALGEHAGQIAVLAYRLLKGSGRRVGEVASLRLDCLDVDEHGKDVLVYDNHKAGGWAGACPRRLRAGGGDPRPTGLGDRLLPRHAAEALWLLPGPHKNVDGTHHLTAGLINAWVRTWVHPHPPD